jgi:hypothetical protein
MNTGEIFVKIFEIHVPKTVEYFMNFKSARPTVQGILAPFFCGGVADCVLKYVNGKISKVEAH